MQEILAPSAERIVILGDDGIELRQLFIEDAQSVHELAMRNLEHIKKYNSAADANYGSARQIAQTLQIDGLNRFGIYKGAELIGDIFYWLKKDKSAEISYWIDENNIRQGNATRAIKALANYALDNPDSGIDKLVAKVKRGNKYSSRALYKAGFNMVDFKVPQKDEQLSGREGRQDNIILIFEKARPIE